MSCKDCRQAWSYSDDEPPCEECYPGIHKYNEDAYTLFSNVASQYIMGPSGPVSLNALAIDRVCDYFNVELHHRPGLIRKVQTISSHLVATQLKRADSK